MNNTTNVIVPATQARFMSSGEVFVEPHATYRDFHNADVVFVVMAAVHQEMLDLGFS